MMLMVAARLFAVLLALSGLLAEQLSPDVTCDEDSVKAAASLAVQHINKHHKHGFKFKLQDVQSSKYQQFSGGCHIDVNMKLVQTKCHFTNPKPLEECPLWRRDQRGATAACSVEFWVMWDVAKITKYDCTTRPERTNDEMQLICPSCPKLLPLNDPIGVRAVEQAVHRFNQESREQSYFTLLEVARLTSWNVASIGNITWLKFALVETMCPREPKNPRTCTPRCPNRAHHVFCQTAYFNTHNQVGELECEIYPPRNLEPLLEGEEEPVCGPLFHQSPEACVCKERLKKPELSVHHICPFPLK
ncbi:antihemorrhagic factor BJ46a-like [Corythoichthys intestinalis]|uniref:antihemorrhagic factor BJ46a-like n=1 Tax=Corythoichthys intestinalis TaxID=161448 RepID=UPI0025A53D79|nr:antihemorrhagic factor BJ46a-like [Corythoichthys intestinalis]XP_061806819.1 antihemorrhagic factor BJ46a-like [Nerophis lumbriciformis]